MNEEKNVEKMYEKMFEIAKLFDDIMPKIVEVVEDPEQMIMFAGTMIDNWCFARKINVEDSKKMVDTLCEIHHQVNDQLGNGDDFYEN